MNSFTIRKASLAAILAQTEGWNPGQCDALLLPKQQLHCVFGITTFELG